jgi:Holliday junction DNA helicase RuvA
MIGKLTGLVDSVGDDWLIVDVAGVGYQVHCSTRTLARLPAVGDRATFAIETHVREDMIRLFGFESPIERDWFRLLQSIQGVGAKLALAILGVLSPSELSKAIIFQDKASLTRVSGVGQRVAARLVTELKDKALPTAEPILAGTGADPVAAMATDEGDRAKRDALSALVNLGYGESQAAAALAQAAVEASVEDLIRLGLRELSR